MFYLMHVQQRKKPGEQYKPMRLEFAVTNQETVLEFAKMFERTREIEAYWVHSANGPTQAFHLGFGGNNWKKWQIK